MGLHEAGNFSSAGRTGSSWPGNRGPSGPFERASEYGGLRFSPGAPSSTCENASGWRIEECPTEGSN